MVLRKARLFLGNLPQNSSEDDVRRRLQKYGTLNSVEIKQKKDIDNKTVASTFAFVNIETEDSTLQQCLYELRGRDWNGSYIKAELAKESFLDRLQREREEASNSSSLKTNEQQQDTFKRCSITAGSLSVEKEHDNRKKKTLVENDSQEIARDRILVSKLESFSDLWKDDPPAGLARFPKKDGTPRKLEPHGEQTIKSRFSKDEFTWNNMPNNFGDSADRSSQMCIDANSKSQLPETGKDSAAKVAELKRIKALEEKSKALKQQKDAIKHALSSIDHAKPSNKITFDDDGDPVNTLSEQQKPGLNKHGKKDENKFNIFSKGKQTLKTNGQLQLFDGDDDNDNWQGDFRFKKQFEGKKGKRLLEMQARFKDDDRFVIDERFYESDEEKEKTEESLVLASEEGKELQEEKAKEKEILASVLGEPVQQSVPKKNIFNPMVRFDPMKPSHAKFELPKPNDTKLKSVDIDLKKKPGKLVGDKEPGSQRVGDDDQPPVDEKQFYKVASNLKDLFKKENKEVQSTETTSFSLRQIFSSSNKDNEPREEVVISEPKFVENTHSKSRPAIRPMLRGFQDSKPLAMFTRKLLRPEINGVTNTFCQDVDVEAIKVKFSEKRRILGRMLHKKKVILERQQHFKQKIGAASLAHKSLDRESAVRRKFVKPWEKKRNRR